MKKLPVLLLILTLAGVMPVREAWALDREANEIEQGLETEQKLIDERKTTELPAVHNLDQRFQIQAIKPREGMVDIEVTSPIEEEWQVQRAWFATIDYENGWTEVEVDEMLGNWTVLEAEWAKVTKEYTFSNAPSHLYATVVLNVGESRLVYDLAEVNLLDVLYYAVEFRDLADEDAEVIWVRGKVDYRGCAHAKSFEEGRTEVCAEVVDWGAETMKYWAADATEDEEVVSWEEEWRLVLAGRLGQIGAVLDGLAMIPEMSAEALGQSLAYEEEKLTKIEMLLTKATGVEEEVSETARLRERIATMRNGDNMEEDMEEGGSVGSAGETSEEKPGVSDEELGDGSGELSGSFGEASGEGGEISGGLDEISGKTEGIFGELNGVSTETSRVDERGEEEGEAKVASNNIEKNEEGIEVPRLGEMQSGRGGWIWWVVGLSGVMALFLVMVLKRKQRK